MVFFNHCVFVMCVSEAQMHRWQLFVEIHFWQVFILIRRQFILFQSSVIVAHHGE